MSQLPRLIGVALAVAIAAPLVRAQQAEPAPAAPPPAAATPAAPAPADAAAPPATAPAAAAPGAEAPATQPAAAAPAAAPADQTIQENARNFFHYTLIARYDMADAQLQQLLGRDPKEVLPALQAEARDREMDLDAFLLRKLDVPELKKDLTTLRNNIEKARGLKAEDPNYIEEQIKKLAGGERERTNALTRLRQSGEMAVPQMVAMLRDPTKMQYHPGIRWGLFNLGRPILNPLVAATDMRDNPQALIAVADVLAQIGSPDVVPYLQRLVQDKDTSQIVKSAVSSSLTRMGQDPRGRAAEGFYDLANKGFYYRTSGITYDNRNPAAYVWFWDAQRGFLTKKDTPPATWHDIMAMRASETALRLGTTRDAVSLWLAANNRREADTPEGQTSGVYADTPAHFWNVRLGAQYCNSVLARALSDQTTPVALKVVRSLQEIVGVSNLFSAGTNESPLLTALRYADRQVRYEAAIAVGSALPNRPFAGQERVVQLLAEAVSQTGAGGVVVLAPSEQARNAMESDLKKTFAVAGGTSANAAVGDSARLPAVDAVVISEQVPADQIQQFMSMAAQTPSLERAAKVIIVRSGASPWVRQGVTDRSISTTTMTAGEGLVKAIEAGRRRAGGSSLDEKAGADFARRAADLLGKLAVLSRSRGTVLDVSLAERTLLASLNDKRPEVATAVARVLGEMDSRTAQAALLDKGADGQTPEEVRVAAFKGIATNAKYYGNRLDAGHVDTLRKIVQAEPNQPVKNAAAEAMGALNLPVEQIKALILDRPRQNGAAAAPGTPATGPAAPATTPEAPAPGTAPAPAAPAETPAAPPATTPAAPPAAAPAPGQ
jgi:HEAT repeats